MRAIDADALRDRLQNLGYDDWNQGTTTTWAEAFNECADMVDEQPAIELEQKWIPCRERMPEKGQKCLVCDKGAIAIDTFICNGKPYDWKWYMRDYEAWMALPEPYKKEGR